MKSPVTIVVPVYGDWPSLSECISSLKQFVNTSVHKVVLVNDCGPDVETIEKNTLAKIKGVQGFEYHRNTKNVGFVGTCNRAVNELDRSDNEVLLLNSDTKVTEGFLEEMTRALYVSRKNGAVSPRSNNATIATVPLSSAAQKGIDPEDSYKIFQKIKSRLPRYSEVPVAHGFCMLIRRTLIKKYGLFDEAFGKGYGEEVDFCRRIAKDGYKSVLANRAYVFHLEARSFTLETKAELLQVNNKIIWKRYPEYRQLVKNYMELTVPAETRVEEEMGIKYRETAGVRMKRIVTRNKSLHKVGSRIIRKLRDNSI